MRAPATVLAFVLLAAGQSRAQLEPTGPFEEELKRYEGSLGYKALYLRAVLAERFARTKDARALKVLLRRYAEPDEPAEQVRYVVAGLIGESFDRAEDLEPLTAATARLDKAPDCWLVWQALRLQARLGKPEAVLDLATDPKRDAFLRATGLEALVLAKQHEQVLGAIARVLSPTALKKLKPLERAVLLETCAAALAAAKEHTASEPFASAIERVIAGLEEKKLEQRTRLVIARALARALDAPSLWLEPDPWRKFFAGRAAEARAKAEGEGGGSGTRPRLEAGAGFTTPRFFGIEGAGIRVVFVVDLSDSMLIPLKPAEVEELKRPRTGDPPPGGEKKQEPDTDLKDLPWDRIKNRFEAAREALKLSLRSLGEEMSFAVVVFGTKAEALTGPSLIKATPKNREKAIEALDALKTGKPEANREHGTLKGHTNLHGGLRLAFKLVEGPQIPAHEHVAPAGFASGCDTVFVLSDGAPSWDDFDQEDVRVEGLVGAGDPEDRNKKGPDVPRLHYYGPYADPRFLVRDLARMNMFRRVEVHCVGIGEANTALLKQITDLCQGELRTIAGGK